MLNNITYKDKCIGNIIVFENYRQCNGFHRNSEEKVW